MTKDRIKDLQANSLNHQDQNSKHDTNGQSTTINIDRKSQVIEFLNKIEIIRSVIGRIDELAQQVKQIHIAMLQPTANSKLGQELDDKTEEVKKLAYETSTRLKNMEQTEGHPENADMTSAQWRIKASQIFVLTRYFRDTMMEYNKESVLHRERCKKIIAREFEMSGHQRNTDELEEMLENGFPGTFNFSIMIKTQKTQQSLDEIEARHRDITKLENSIRELHHMFLDLAILVTDQGEMIDSIEHNVSNAVEYVEDAAEDIIITDRYRKKIVKKKCILLIILLVSVVLIIVILLIGYFTQKQIRGK